MSPNRIDRKYTDSVVRGEIIVTRRVHSTEGKTEGETFPLPVSELIMLPRIGSMFSASEEETEDVHDCQIAKKVVDARLDTNKGIKIRGLNGRTTQVELSDINQTVTMDLKVKPERMGAKVGPLRKIWNGIWNL
jgi:hypothetical protein